MFCLLILEIVPFAERNDNILKQIENQYEIFSSGSIGQYYDGKCNPTLPEHSVDSVTRKSDWCSNVNKSSNDHPWLVLHIPHKSIKLNGYALRAGCCYYDCCCINDNQYVYCCCALYSWSVQGSRKTRILIIVRTNFSIPIPRKHMNTFALFKMNHGPVVQCVFASINSKFMVLQPNPTHYIPMKKTKTQSA